MRYLISLPILFAVGCAQVPSAQRSSLVNTETTVRPQEVAVQPMSKGSLVPQFNHMTPGVRGLFEERRISRVGDTMMVILNETTRASKDGGTRANRLANGVSTAGVNFSNVNQAKSNANSLNLGLNSTGNTSFDANGAASASNQFSGTITATVMEVLANGNLVIAGEKKNCGWCRGRIHTLWRCRVSNEHQRKFGALFTSRRCSIGVQRHGHHR